MPLNEITVTDTEQLLRWDGDTFDAMYLWYPTVVETDGDIFLYYAGGGFGNSHNLGLAVSTDEFDFIRYSNQSIISPSEEPAWASFRFVPTTVLYEDGIYRMWFWGNDTNLFTNPNNTHGFGYAESTDGVSWSINPDPIRVEDGAREGSRLVEVVNLDGQYIAYYRDISPFGELLMSAVSDDGVEFSGDAPVGLGADYDLLAATVYEGVVVSVWRHDGQFSIAESLDGQDFEITNTLSLPTGFTPRDIVVEDGTITFYAQAALGNIDWNWGNHEIQMATADFTLTLNAVPLSTGFVMPVGNRDGLTLTEETTVQDGWMDGWMDGSTHRTLEISG